LTENLTCDLNHKRSVPAALKLEIRSTRAGKPGHPMVRVAAVCIAHARELRRLGIELIQA